MTQAEPPKFSRRERQIMEVLYRLGEGSVADVIDLMADAPSYDAVRLALGVLEEKGHVRHRREGRRYVYRPTTPIHAASRSALRQLTRTYFRGSPQKAVLAMLDASAQQMSDRELEEIAEWIRADVPLYTGGALAGDEIRTSKLARGEQPGRLGDGVVRVSVDGGSCADGAL